MLKNEEAFLKLLEKEMVPALGCTEPIGVAFAAALARKHAKGDIVSLRGELSVNIIKNAAAVAIPGTEGRCGVALAMALGAAAGDSDKSLEVLMGISPEDVETAIRLIQEGRVSASPSDDESKLYIRILLETTEDTVEAVIRDSYSNIASLVVNGRRVMENNSAKGNPEPAEALRYDLLSLDSIYEFAAGISIEKLKIIENAIDVNTVIATEGISKEYGLAVGRSIKDNIDSGLMGEDLANLAVMWTAAGTDARMAGSPFPVISNTGSGNQGLASTLPVISAAAKLCASREQLIRAVTISSLVTIYIKEKLGALSAVCGAVIAATGSSCGIVYLLGGDAKHMVYALHNTLGDVSGMLCDGAKASCALKVATCTNTAVMAALLSLKEGSVKGTDGIVGYTEKETIDNFIRVATEGMNRMDQVLLDIILQKEKAEDQ